MRITHAAADTIADLLNQLSEPDQAQVALCYATESVDSLRALCEAVAQQLPHVAVVGITTDQVIMDGQVHHASFAVSLVTLKSGICSLDVVVGLDEEAAHACQAWLDRQEADVFVVWSTGVPASIDAFWQRIRFPAPMVGGVPSFCRQERQRVLWAQGRLVEAGSVVLALKGQGVRFEVVQQGGWRPVTRTHRITAAKQGRIYEIDHQPAVTLYHHYLGSEHYSAETLHEVGLAFPLMVEMAPDSWVIRGVLRFHDDGSLECVGDVPEGAAVRLAVGSVNQLLSSVKSPESGAYTGALVFVCLGRRMLLGEHTQKTLVPFCHDSSGFFSYGELFAAPSQPGHLLNHTLVALTATYPEEQTAQPTCVVERAPVDTTDLLANLLGRVHEDTARIERLLTLASNLIVQFEFLQGRWVVQRVMGKASMLGYASADQLEAASDLFARLEESGRQRLQAFLAQGDQARLIHTRIKQVDGRWLPVALLMLREGNQLLWLLEDQSAQQALTRIYEMFERGPVVQFEWSGEPGWPIRYVSPNVTDVLGLPYEEIASGDKSFADFVFPDDLQRVVEEVEHFLANHIVDFQQEYRIVTPKGEVRWVRDYTHVIYGDDGQSETIYGFVLDITQEKEALHQLEEEKRQAAWQAMHDPLTGLYNRTYLRDIFPALLRQAERQGWVVDLMFIDLDNFKEINDVHGHSVGDQILRQFSIRLRRLLRRHDVIARFGGDEFVVAAQIEEQDAVRVRDRARVLAEKILSALEQPFDVDGESFKLSASIGIVLVDGKEKTDFETLIRYADTSMYLAKRDGRNGYRFFDHSQQQQEEERALKLTALRQAVENQELCLAYQPQVHWDGQRFELCGAEVLMRWQSQQFGPVSPAEFIPLAEETGYILELGNWMVEAALQQLAKWRAQALLPPDFILSLNISAMQFYQADFTDMLSALCARHDIPPAAVRLELTERIIYKGTEAALDRLTQLRRLGFSTSLDDFGTGYSSLAYLKRMDLDELKIDQTFVRNFLQDESNAVLTRTIIELAHNFKLTPIAEGTERLEEVRALIQMGCCAFQGYYFGKPMFTEDFERWVADSPLDQLSLEAAGRPHC